MLFNFFIDDVESKVKIVLSIDSMISFTGLELARTVSASVKSPSLMANLH